MFEVVLFSFCTVTLEIIHGKSKYIVGYTMTYLGSTSDLTCHLFLLTKFTSAQIGYNFRPKHIYSLAAHVNSHMSSFTSLNELLLGSQY